MGDSSATSAETTDRKSAWPKWFLFVSILLWLLAWEAIVWFVPVQPRVVLRTSDRLEGFSPDSRILVTGPLHDGFLTGQIHLWDVNTGHELEVVGEVRTNLLANVVYLGQRDIPYENRIIEKLDPGVDHKITLVLYDLRTRRETGIICLDLDLFTSHSLCFAPDGRTLAICTGRESENEIKGDIKLIDVATGQVRARLDGAGFRELAFSLDGSTLAMMHDPPLGDDKEPQDVTIILLHTVTGEKQKELRIDGGGLFPLDFSFDGQKLATFCFKRKAEGLEREVNIWDLSNENMMSLKGERYAVFLPDSKALATCDEDRHMIRFVEERTGKEFAVVSNSFSYDWCPTFFMPIPGSHILVMPTTHDVKPSLLFQRLGNWLRIAGLGAERHDQELAFLDTRTGNKVAAIVREGMDDPRISMDGKTLAVSSFDEDEKFIELWDIPPRKPLRWVLGLLAIPSVMTLVTFWRWWRRH